MSNQDLEYLKLLSEHYPNVESSVRAIVDMSAILKLPKGTEYFFSDLHGENAAFIQLLRSASGVIRDKIDTVYSFTLSEQERDELAALIAHPHTCLQKKRKNVEHYEAWSALIIHRLVQVCREVASKYNRKRVVEVINPKFANIIDDLILQDPMCPTRPNTTESSSTPRFDAASETPWLSPSAACSSRSPWTSSISSGISLTGVPGPT